jgi:hypothetical protein
MRTVVIEVANVAVEDAAGVSFVVNQHPVGALRSGRCRRTILRSSSPGACGEGS